MLEPQPNAKFEIAFGRVGEGASARAALDLLEDEMLSRQHTLDLEIFRALDKRETPTYERFLTIFAQKHACWKLLQQLQAKVESSKSAARTLQPLMEAQNARQ